MHCNQCGRDVPEGSVFCPQCGGRLAGGAQATASVASAAPAPTNPDATAAERLRTNDGHAHPTPEDELWTGTYSPKAMIGTAVFAAGLTVAGGIAASFAGPVGVLTWVAGVAVMWVLVALVLVYRRLTVHYRLTSYRFFTETGLFGRVNNRIQAIDIDDVTVQQGPIERMLGLGTIIIRARDDTSPVLTLRGIEDAPRVADMIDGARRAERNRRGLYVAEM
jgi:membrane protein YdbS with pleckstrin-like domain